VCACAYSQSESESESESEAYIQHKPNIPVTLGNETSELVGITLLCAHRLILIRLYFYVRSVAAV